MGSVHSSRLLRDLRIKSFRNLVQKVRTRLLHLQAHQIPEERGRAKPQVHCRILAVRDQTQVKKLVPLKDKIQALDAE